MITAATLQQQFQNWALKFGLSPVQTTARSTSVAIARIHLQTGQHYTLPVGTQSLCILSGRLWITYRGKDEIVYPGQTLQFPSDLRTIELWTLQQQAVIFELQFA